MSRQHPGELSAKQRQAIDALLTCSNVKEAAMSINVPARTVWSWLATPHFKVEYEKQATAGADMVKSQISGLAERAIEALKESLDSPSHLAKIQAIKIIVDRLYPETRIQRVDGASEPQGGPLPAELLPYLLEEELYLIETLMERARARKAEQVPASLRV